MRCTPTVEELLFDKSVVHGRGRENPARTNLPVVSNAHYFGRAILLSNVLRVHEHLSCASYRPEFENLLSNSARCAR